MKQFLTGLVRRALAVVPRNTGLLLSLARAAEALGHPATGVRFRAERLRHLIPRHLASRNLTGILDLMAEMERTGLAAQFSAGRLLAEEIVTGEGRQRLLEAAGRARRQNGDSAFLAHLAALGQAMEGDHITASGALVTRIAEIPHAPDWLHARRFRLLEQSWRIVDLIARERMDWAENEGGHDDPAATRPGSPPAMPIEDAERVLSFKEYALQRRLRETFLDLCRRDFETADTLPARLVAIQAMLRPSIRHIPDYSDSFARASASLDSIKDELERLFTRQDKDPGAQVGTLCTLLLLARRLGRPELAARIGDQLEALSNEATCHQYLWPAPAALARDPDCIPQSKRIMARIRHKTPRINQDMQNALRWAQLVQDDAWAEAMFTALPESMQRGSGALYHVNILQRQGRFSEARTLLRDIHGQALANPSKVNAVSNHSMIKRAGELDFLVETADIWNSVPQPTHVQGIVVVPARNIDALRRYPILVLLELKRRGWAVLPLVQGLLPSQPTGRPEIDVLGNAITPNQHLTAQAAELFPDLADFEADPARGTLTWAGMELSHAVWEDAAINRRRYTINYGCPELQSYLGMLMDWSRLFARALRYAHETGKRNNLPVMHMSLFNARLPDAIYSGYARTYGDPGSFFHVHVANGYQNYFTNFSTNLSHRFVLRNTTLASEIRSASFPRPQNFRHYYEAARPRLPEIRERFAHVTRIRRSTGDVSERPPEAEIALTRIRKWKALGGHVACAFGKVVCDSAVPFDGGPVHRSMQDWINHCVRTVAGSKTLLLIKPHPHELNNQIATFLTQYFTELINEPIGDNVIILGHRWFDIHDLKEFLDLGLIYNGTTAVELGLLDIPCLLAGHFGPIDYPIGHPVAGTRSDFEAALRFERPVKAMPDLADRAAVWLDYMANEEFTLPYRYHARPVTNTVLYPPWWIKDDLERYRKSGDPAINSLTDRALGIRGEPGDPRQPV